MVGSGHRVLLDILQEYPLLSDNAEFRKKPMDDESETAFQYIADILADGLNSNTDFEIFPHYVDKCSLEGEFDAYNNSLGEDAEKVYALDCFVGAILIFRVGIVVQKLFLLKLVEEFRSNTDDVLPVHDGFDQSRNGG